MGLSELYKEYKVKKAIKSKWELFMERVNNVDLTKKDNSFKKTNYFIMEDIFIKHYGFDCVITMPYDKSLNDFRKLLPAISVLYRGEVIAEYSSTKSSVYMRCHLQGLKIDELDNIKFQWYGMFADSKMRNSNGETFKLSKSEKIYHPTKIDKEGNKELIGYRFNINMPVGLNYEILESNLINLNKFFGICSLHFDDKKNKIFIEIMNKKVPDNEKFEPIKVKPWELHCGITHYYKPIKMNFKESPNCLIGGASGTGKTIAMIMAMLNLILMNDANLVNLYITMLSDKQDLRAFKNTKHCKYYANTYKDALKELSFLSKEVSRRNKLFSDIDEYGSITNIYEYNKLKNTKKLPLIYFCIDEVASFSVNGIEENDCEKNIKKRCESLLWKIVREGRSSGVYCILATQRGSLANMSGEIKGNLGNQLSFYFPNVASALTILGDGDLASLAIKQRKQREFIGVCDEIYNGKTLYLDMKMVINYLKPLIDKNKQFMKLDNKGNIVVEKESEENKLETIKDNKNIKELKEVDIKRMDFRTNKPKSRWNKYQEEREKAE
ncbi:hypothetical protein DVV91_17180 [Clostridium botulinum]|uniref:FtsK/SpoIIIE domain-containing protein n=1 Tax=Clostridium botulinum TaxID=1491 RepID=UPI00196739BF|nr:FtsK/SpoIIIE domain-containing protein [Clostridium botulinum]MBN1076055.1 hypothetical protein [Clostridium botulinum]